VGATRANDFPRRQPAACPPRQPRLADASVPDHEHQPRVPAQRHPQAGQLTLTADEPHRPGHTPPTRPHMPGQSLPGNRFTAALRGDRLRKRQLGQDHLGYITSPVVWTVALPRPSGWPAEPPPVMPQMRPEFPDLSRRRCG
jgi:hypothetical protein